MKKLTKTAIVVTCLSLAVLYITAGVLQQLVTDGKRTICIVTWHIPFYGTVRLQEQTWWTFTQIWLSSLSIPPILWV
jgi:uncharacterized membrane protein YiaA